MTETFLAWAAGFFDGEGSVSIFRHTRRNRASGRDVYEMRVIVTQKVAAPLDLLQEAFGGYRLRPENGCEKWCASSRVAERFLLAIRPYTVVKTGQIDIALTFQARRIKHGQGSARVLRGVIERNAVLDAADLILLRELKQAPLALERAA